MIKEYLPLIVSLLAVLIAWRKAPSEAKKNDAGAANDYASAAQRYAELAHEQRLQIDSMEAKQHDMEVKLTQALNEIDKLRKENAELKAENVRINEKIEELCMFNALLTKQAKENGITPITVEEASKVIAKDKALKRKVGASRD